MEENLNTQNAPEGEHEETEREEKAGKMFTQDEVNRIVQERLARDRAKRDKEDGVEDILNNINEREAGLIERESRIKCHELILEKGYSKDLLDILDTSNPEKFAEQAEKIEKMTHVPRSYPGTEPNKRTGSGQVKPFGDTAHIPKMYR